MKEIIYLYYSLIVGQNMLNKTNITVKNLKYSLLLHHNEFTKDQIRTSSK